MTTLSQPARNASLGLLATGPPPPNLRPVRTAMPTQRGSGEFENFIGAALTHLCGEARYADFAGSPEGRRLHRVLQFLGVEKTKSDAAAAAREREARERAAWLRERVSADRGDFVMWLASQDTLLGHDVLSDVGRGCLARYGDLCALLRHMRRYHRPAPEMVRSARVSWRRFCGDVLRVEVEV